MSTDDDMRPSRSGSLPRLSIRMKGPNVGEPRLAVSDFVEIVRRTQQALKRIGQVLYGDPSEGRGRKKKDIEELCQLFLVGWHPGSAIAVLELAEPPKQLEMFGYIGERSLEAFIDGIGTISREAEPPTRPPTGFDPGVLQTCNGIGIALEHGIESISFRSENGRQTEEALYDSNVRERLQSLLGQPVDTGRTSKVGRLDMLNGHQGLVGNLWEPDGTKWICHFQPDHAELLSEAWLKTVKLTGRAITEERRAPILEVESILVTDENLTVGDARAVPFWVPTSLDELIEQQGVSPADDLDEIAALWPADSDPDQFLSHLLTERREQRRLTRAEEDV
ncbi:MAG: hypothetical protein QGD90_02790 [Candidatus Hydrogenedentes bacterium]|nr:hypothetical protein [Candidatus Hydrogenedentota bacterium]